MKRDNKKMVFFAKDQIMATKRKLDKLCGEVEQSHQVGSSQL